MFLVFWPKLCATFLWEVSLTKAFSVSALEVNSYFVVVVTFYLLTDLVFFFPRLGLGVFGYGFTTLDQVGTTGPSYSLSVYKKISFKTQRQD